MSVILTFLILIAPFAIAMALSWVAHRGQPMRTYLAAVSEDRDDYRVEHDMDAVRTRFERSPMWPASGAMGERR
jgi:hypothetical protein